jgi:DNA polymerase
MSDIDRIAALVALKNEVEQAHLPLSEEATHVVFGKGNPHAKILFIGEAPGEKEDLEGIPFVGRAGKELDKALSGIGLSLDDVYVANILKYRPPKNRDPNKDEMLAHTPYLIKQIEIIRPTIIATLGNYATKFVLNGFSPKGMQKVPGISTIHGKEHEKEINGNNYLVIPIYHPAAMMYNPKVRVSFEEDFSIFASILANEN